MYTGRYIQGGVYRAILPGWYIQGYTTRVVYSTLPYPGGVQHPAIPGWYASLMLPGWYASLMLPGWCTVSVTYPGGVPSVLHTRVVDLLLCYTRVVGLLLCYARVGIPVGTCLSEV